MDRTLFLCGLAFTLVGGVFTVIGLVFLLPLLAQQPLLVVFPLLGIVFLALGLGMLFYRRLHSRRSAALLENGQLVWAELVDVRLDTRFSVNRRHPWVLCCQAVEPRTNELCLFASDDLWFDPRPYLRPGMKVPVYVDPGDWGFYVVDTAAVLPEPER